MCPELKSPKLQGIIFSIIGTVNASTEYDSNLTISCHDVFYVYIKMWFKSSPERTLTEMGYLKLTETQLGVSQISGWWYGKLLVRQTPRPERRRGGQKEKESKWRKELFSGVARDSAHPSPPPSVPAGPRFDRRAGGPVGRATDTPTHRWFRAAQLHSNAHSIESTVTIESRSSGPLPAKPAFQSVCRPGTFDRFSGFLIRLQVVSRGVCAETGCRNCPWMTTSRAYYQILKVCWLSDWITLLLDNSFVVV